MISSARRFLRKEVIQPQVLLRLPCYDLVLLTKHSFNIFLQVALVRYNVFGCILLGWLDGRCVQGSGTYSPRHC